MGQAANWQCNMQTHGQKMLSLESLTQAGHQRSPLSLWFVCEEVSLRQRSKKRRIWSEVRDLEQSSVGWTRGKKKKRRGNPRESELCASLYCSEQLWDEKNDGTDLVSLWSSTRKCVHRTMRQGPTAEQNGWANVFFRLSALCALVKLYNRAVCLWVCITNEMMTLSWQCVQEANLRSGKQMDENNQTVCGPVGRRYIDSK